MRFLTLALVLLFQDAPTIPPEWMALAEEAADLDPDARDAARRKLETLVGPQKESLRKVAKETENAAIVVGLLGDSAGKSTLVKLTRSGEARIRAMAAEALGAIGSDQGQSDLLALLDDADLTVAVAASRNLPRLKSKTAGRELLKAIESHAKNPRRALVAACGADLLDHGAYSSFIRRHFGDSSLREAAFAVANNTPSVVDFLNHQFEEKTYKRVTELKTLLEKEDLSPLAIDLLGILCVRSGIINNADVAAYLKQPGKLAEWAMRRLPRMTSTRRSTIAHDVVKIIEEKAKSKVEADLNHLKALEAFLNRLTGLPNVEGDPEERAKAHRAWFERVRSSMIDADVVRAIDDGVAWLRARQEKDGSFIYCRCGYEVYSRIDYTAGTTALCGYTLLKMGVAPEDPAVTKAATYLLDIPIEKITNDPTYSLSLQAMFLAELVTGMKGKKGDRKTKQMDAVLQGRSLKRIQECVEWLVNNRIQMEKGGYEQCAWTYRAPLDKKTHDHSNTQFAILGLIAGQNVGVKVPLRVWQAALGHWKGVQYEEGGWYYTPPQPETPKTGLVGSVSMTGAGMASVLITQAASKNTATEKVAETEESIKRAMKKWEKAYPIPAVARNENMGHVFSIYYDLYSVERAMMLGGFTKIGDKDWYHDGALYILYNQMHNGAWLDTTDTCFALLFLKKAYVAVASGGEK